MSYKPTKEIRKEIPDKVINDWIKLYFDWLKSDNNDIMEAFIKKGEVKPSKEETPNVKMRSFKLRKPILSFPLDGIPEVSMDKCEDYYYVANLTLKIDIFTEANKLR